MSRYDDPRRLPQPVQVADGSRRDAAILALQAAQPLAWGTATLVGGTKAVAVPAITAGSTVTYSVKTLAGTTGLLSFTIAAGVGFTVTSLSALDTSTFSYTVMP